MTKKLIYFICAGLVALSSCKKDEEPDPPLPDPEEEMLNTVPEFYEEAVEDEYGIHPPEFEVLAGSPIIKDPWDLDFNFERPDELWVINHSIESVGGSVTIFFEAGTDGQSFERKTDGNAWHFMSLPSAIAFGDNGNFATTTAVKDANHSGGTFTGPSLWSGDLSIFAEPSGGNGSHLDMLHGSPHSMGIAHEKDNVYWVYDGYHEHIVRYDFVDDHGPGNDYHGDALVHRYGDVEVKWNPDAPSHMILDKTSGWLYIADNGNKRIIRMDINSGVKKSDLPLINEPLEEHWEMGDTKWEVFAETGLSAPAGIELVDNRLFVSDFDTGEIIAYDTESKSELARISTGSAGIMGLKVGPDGKLWFVNQADDELVRILPVQAE